MRVIVYSKNTSYKEFNTHGYGKLRLIKSCKVIEELNGRYEIELVVDLLDTKAKYLTKWAVIRVNTQLFRITDIIANDKDRTLKVIANHIFYDINYGFLVDTRAEGKTLTEALQIALPEDFNHFSIIPGDIADKNNIYYVKDNGVEAVFRTMEKWKVGELVRDNFSYGVRYNKGKDNGVTFTYKKIDGIEITEVTDEVVTQLYPTGFDGISLPEKYVIIPNWNIEDYPPFHITREVYFEGAESTGELRELSRKKAEEIGLLTTNFKINVSDLLSTELYTEMAQLMTVDVGDIVTIKHSKLNVRVKVKVIKKEEDLATKSVVLELGQPLSNFFKSVDNSNLRVDIPSMEEYKDGMFYYTNVLEELINPTADYKELLFLNFTVGDSANLVLYFNAFTEVYDDGLVEFSLWVDNKELVLKPKQSVTTGFHMLTFTYPLIAIDGDSSHSMSIRVKSSGRVSIDKEHLQVVIKGQNTIGGKSAESPHAEAITDVLYEPIICYTIDMAKAVEVQEVERVNMVENVTYINMIGTYQTVESTVSVNVVRVADLTEFNPEDDYMFNMGEVQFINNKAIIDTINTVPLSVTEEVIETDEGIEETVYVYSCGMPNLSDIRTLFNMGVE